MGKYSGKNLATVYQLAREEVSRLNSQTFMNPKTDEIARVLDGVKTDLEKRNPKFTQEEFERINNVLNQANTMIKELRGVIEQRRKAKPGGASDYDLLLDDWDKKMRD